MRRQRAKSPTERKGRASQQHERFSSESIGSRDHKSRCDSGKLADDERRGGPAHLLSRIFDCEPLGEQRQYGRVGEMEDREGRRKDRKWAEAEEPQPGHWCARML